MVLIESNYYLFVSQVNAAVEYCRIEVPNEGSFILNANKQTSWMGYFGGGFDNGDCGIKIFHAKESHNGEFICGISAGESGRETTGKMNLTIASKAIYLFFFKEY